MPPEIRTPTNLRAGNLQDIAPTLMRVFAWFLRMTGALILLVSTAGLLQKGWPHSLEASSSLTGLFNGLLLFVLSFFYLATGKTRQILSVISFTLGLCVLAFAAARLWLPFLET